MGFRLKTNPEAFEERPKGEAKRIGLAALALLAVIALGCAMGAGYDGLLRLLEGAAEDVPVEQSVEGLPAGTALDDAPNDIVGSYAVFSDRAVKLFKTDEATLSKCVEAQARLMETIPEGVSRYLMVMPTRATFEPSLADLTEDELAAIDYAYGAMPNDVTCVDAAGRLQEHAGSYLYYRTHLAPTYEGAYWASRAFIEAAGVPGIDISEYRADDRQVFNGSYLLQFDLVTVGDDAPVYIHPGLPNNELVSCRLDDGIVSELYEAPALAISRGSYYASVGDGAVFAVLDGAAENGRTALVLGDSECRLFSTWLIASFDRVVFLSIDWCPLSHEEFSMLFDEYGVTDFVLYQSVDSLSLGNGNTTLSELAGEE